MGVTRLRQLVAQPGVLNVSICLASCFWVFTVSLVSLLCKLTVIVFIVSKQCTTHNYNLLADSVLILYIGWSLLSSVYIDDCEKLTVDVVSNFRRFHQFLCLHPSSRWGWRHSVFGLFVHLCICVQAFFAYDGGILQLAYLELFENNYLKTVFHLVYACNICYG